MAEDKVTPKEKAKKLGWLSPSKESQEGGPGNMASIWVTAIISLVLAVLVVFLMAPSKGDLTNLSTDLDNHFSELSASLDTKFSDLSKSQSSKLSKVETTVSSLEGKLSNLKIQVGTLSGLEEKVDTAIKGIDTKVNTKVKAEIADLKARLKELEDSRYTPEGGVAVSGDLTAELQIQFFEYVVLPTGTSTDKVVSVPLRLKLTNSSSRDIEDIRVVLTFKPRTYAVPDWDALYPQLAGGFTTWATPYGSYAYGMIFVNGWGLRVNANDSSTIELTLAMKVDVPTTEDFIWEPEVTIEDFGYE